MILSVRTYFPLFLLLAIVQGGCAQNVPSQRRPIEDSKYDAKLQRLLRFSVPLIGVEELENIQDEVVIFDTRKREEYEVSHIPNARFLGYGEDYTPARLRETDKEQPIVLYCSVGYRSEKVGERLRQEGYTKVYNLYGSIFEWVNQGKPVVDSMGRFTKKVHAYNKSWSQWLTGEQITKVW